MKFFVAIVLFAAVASARILPADLNLTPVELSEVEQIMAAIYSPSTDPTTAAMLEQMLFDLLGASPVVQPPINIPAIIDGAEPIHVGPAIVDQFEPIHVGPAIVDQFEPIHVGPAIVDFPIPEGALAPTPVAPAASTTPLVQIIVNVKNQGAAPSPVQVDHVGGPSPVVVVENPKPVKPTPVQVVDVAEESIIKPTPVQVVEEAGESVIKPTPVQVVEDAFVPQPEPILIGHLPETVAVAPVIVAPAVVGPETLN